MMTSQNDVLLYYANYLLDGSIPREDGLPRWAAPTVHLVPAAVPATAVGVGSPHSAPAAAVVVGILGEVVVPAVVVTTAPVPAAARRGRVGGAAPAVAAPTPGSASRPPHGTTPWATPTPTTHTVRHGRSTPPSTIPTTEPIQRTIVRYQNNRFDFK